MKILLLSTLLISVALLHAGCGESRAVEHPHAEAITPAATYKAGHGVKLTDAGKRFVGLETSEVAPQSRGGADLAAIPVGALLRTVRGDFVYVANGEWFLRTPVVVGRISGGQVEIKDGLYEGDTIVVKGVRALSLSEIQALNGGVGCADGH